MWRREEAEYGYGWETSKEVKEVSLWMSGCSQYVSRHASQLEGKIQYIWPIELLKWNNCGFTPYSGSVM